MTSITISQEKFFSLRKATQEDILSLFQLDTSNVKKTSDEGELTSKQVKSMINGLSDKSRIVLKTITDNFKYDSIPYNQLLKKLDFEDDNLTGVWSGITKRSRNIANDNSFDLIDWNTRDKDGNAIGVMHQNTFEYLSEYL